MAWTPDFVVHDDRPVPWIASGASFWLARMVSAVFSPPLVGLVSIIPVSTNLSEPGASYWAGAYVALVVAVPAAYVMWLLRRGLVTDFDLSVRDQRVRPMLMALACMALGWLALRLGGAPDLLTLVAGATLAQTALMLAITLFWKISAHCAAWAALWVLAWALAGPGAAAIGLVLPLIAWARVRMRRHDLLQTVAGSILGAGLTAVALWLAG
jgi:hypothetical protein